MKTILVLYFFDGSSIILMVSFSSSSKGHDGLIGFLIPLLVLVQSKTKKVQTRNVKSKYVMISNEDEKHQHLKFKSTEIPDCLN